MKLAGIELRYLVNELSEKTKEYYVSNIYGITKESLLFKLHHPEKPDVMLMFSTFGLWTSLVKIEQIEPNKLLKRLRNDLLRLKLIKIDQLNSERIAYLTFQGFDKEFILIGEFFGDGNIILCNKDMKILALLHSLDVRHRKLQVGLQYQPPPQNNLDIFKITTNALHTTISSDLSADRWLGRTLGLPTRYVEAIFQDTNINSKIPCTSLTENDIQNIFSSVQDIVNNVVDGKHEPIIVSGENKSEVYPIKIQTNNETIYSVSSFVEGLDKLFTEKIIKSGKNIQSKDTDKKINELHTKLDEQNKAINTVKEKSKIISNLAKSLLELVTQGISSFNDPIIKDVLTKNNSEFLTEKGITLIKIQNEKIKINPQSSLHTIASSLFDESKKQSFAIPSIEKLKKKTEKQLRDLQNKAENEQDSIQFSEVRKKNWYERYRWFFTSDGNLAIGGRDSSSNSSIIRKHLEKNDIVFHADIFGSPFFILKDANNIQAASLNEVAHATVCFSRAWRESMYGLSAYWVNPDQIKKAAPSGQFLPKGSFTIDGQRNFVKISTLKLGLGLIKQEESFLLSCGPPEVIKKNSVYYAIIEPTGNEMADTAKKIRLEFIKMDEKISKQITIDEFIRALPAGKSHISKVGKGDIDIS